MTTIKYIKPGKMIRTLNLFTFFIFITAAAFGQQPENTDSTLVNGALTPEAKKQYTNEILYSEFYPCYSSKKLEAFYTKHQKENEFDGKKLDAFTFKKLSTKDKFIFSYQHPESYFQSCSMPPYDAETIYKIKGYLIQKMEGFHMSERQRNALTDNRDSIVYYISGCLKIQKNLGNDLLLIVKMIDGFECIPILRNIIENQKVKNPYILTLFMLLMSKNNYAPFLSSGIYEKLYIKKPDLTEILKNKGKEYVPFNQKNYHDILKMTTSFYEWKKSNVKK